MNQTLLKHLQELSYFHVVEIDDDLASIRVTDFRLPEGFNRRSCCVFIEIPSDYPISPPGCPSRIYLPDGIRWRGRDLRDLHPGTQPKNRSGWAWLCFERIEWNPLQDNLITTVELVRTTLTDPPTKGSQRCTDVFTQLIQLWGAV